MSAPTLAELVECWCCEVDAFAAHVRSGGKGMQVPYGGDFKSAPHPQQQVLRDVSGAALPEGQWQVNALTDNPLAIALLLVLAGVVLVGALALLGARQLRPLPCSLCGGLQRLADAPCPWCVQRARLEGGCDHLLQPNNGTCVRCGLPAKEVRRG